MKLGGLQFKFARLIRQTPPLFTKRKKNNVISVRWNGRDLLNTIQAMMGWDLSKGGFRIEGTLLKADHAMLFDLNAAAELN